MEDLGVESSAADGSVTPAAERILKEGIPLYLSPRAASEFFANCSQQLATLGGGDSLLAVKVRAAQVAAAACGGVPKEDIGTTAKLADEALAMANRLGTQLGLGYGLAAWALSRSIPGFTAERVEAANRILDIASECKEPALLPVGYVLLLTGLLELGEMSALDTELLNRRATDNAQTLRPHENPMRWFECLRSILDGDADRATAQADSLLADSPTEGTIARGLHTTQIGMIRWMRGQLGEVEESFLAARREYPDQLLWPASLVWLWFAQGRRSAAETLLRTLPDPQNLAQDRYWLASVVVLAEIATVSPASQDGLKLREMLLPFASHLVPVGMGVAFWGTVAKSLGLLEESLGLFDDAREHLELAVQTSAKVGAMAWHAEAQIELAEFALRHGIVEVPAYELLAEARATAQARGFEMLARRAMHKPRIRVLGGFEVVSLCGQRAVWTSRKARELMKMLVAAQGVATSREVFMDVLWPGESPEALSNRFAVAVNVIRRALDPQRLQHTQQYVVTEGHSVRLEVAELDIDLEQFIVMAKSGDPAGRAKAAAIYAGHAFSDEPYADWAAPVRDYAAHLRARIG